MRAQTFFFSLALSLCVHAVAQPPDKVLPGQQPDGSILLHNQWSLRPAGRQVQLDNFPVNIAVHPRGKFAAVLHSGYGKHEIIVVDLNIGKVASRTPVNETFYGLAFSASGRELFCSGGSDETIHRFEFNDGQITNDVEIQIHDKKLRSVPCGIALDHAAKNLYVANVWGDCFSEVSLGKVTNVTDVALGKESLHVTMSPVVPPADEDVSAAEKRSEVSSYKSDPEDTFPYGCCLDEKRHRLYVSLWAQAAINVIDLKSNTSIGLWPTDEHPCEMALTRSGKLLYVANANRNTVTILDTVAGKTVATIWAAFFPDSPPGATPISLALSPDEKTLYVANATVNAVAVFDVSDPHKSRSLGFIPVGWYPTSVRVTPDGKHLLVANGKGVTPLADPKGPSPGKKSPQYIAGLYQGTLSIIDLPRGDKLTTQMATWTADAYRGIPREGNQTPPMPASADNPVPYKPGDISPIKYVIYVVKENRTYDQILGDMPQGNGDPRICLFPDAITPNEHKLARDFVLLDNFYADAEISADGHEWSMAAYATDFVEKMWPMNYGHNHGGKFPYPSEGYFPVAIPSSGYLWDRAREAGVSYRSYGEFVSYDQKIGQPARARVKALEGHIDPMYRGFDLKYADALRADRFISELKRLETEGDMPRLQIIRLPNDHTHAATLGYPTPSAYVSDNDAALGRIVDAVSHSKFWPETAIFIVEDDAQNGSDHVDAHRTIAFVASPYTRNTGKDSTMYSTTSMLRTMELILGLKPMTQFDTAAMPMFASFHSKPDLQPYDALPGTVEWTSKNVRTAWGGEIKMDFSKEDACDDILLNQVVWKSVRGADSEMPAPIHAAFVLAHKGDDDD